MPAPSSPPKIRLSRLRDIGWSLWDPIGLIEADQSWQDEACRPFENEYDTYLMQAARRLRKGVAEPEVAHDLARIEVEHIGLASPFEKALARAEKVVAAIQADPELWTYPDQ